MKHFKDSRYTNKYIGNSLGEYESKYLLVEQNYSLRDITTIEMLFELVQNNSQLISLFHFTFGSLDQRLHEFGFTESEQLVKYLKEKFDKNIHISPDDMRIKLREYIRKISNRFKYVCEKDFVFRLWLSVYQLYRVI